MSTKRISGSLVRNEAALKYWVSNITSVNTVIRPFVSNQVARYPFVPITMSYLGFVDDCPAE